VQLGEIHLRGTRQRHFTPIQPLVQLYFIEPGRQWPAHARLSATLHAFLDGRAGTAYRRRDLAIA